MASMADLGTDPASSRHAPRLVYRNGQAILTEHGDERPLQPNEVPDAERYVSEFWSRYPTGFQPGVGPQTNAAYDAPKATGAGTPGAARTGWGFTSAAGGRKDFGYTDTDYGRDTSGFYDPHYAAGAAWDTSDENSYDSLKRLSHRKAAGFSVFDESALDQWIARMQADGINVTKVDPYQVDFHNGEGPIQVRNSQDKFWWNNRATEHGAPPAAMSGLATGPSAPTGPSTQTALQAPEVTKSTPVPVESSSAPASAGPDETFLNENVRPFYEAYGATVLEVRGNRMRVRTAEDAASGNTCGTWVDVTPMSQATAPSMSALGY